MANYSDWYLNNYQRASWGRWMPGAPSANEGGVDIPVPAGTPIYALGNGTLQGRGNFWHSANLYTPGSGNPGYGVVTERTYVPGLGMADVYYQHLDLAPGLQDCYAGNCNGQIVTKGQLIGYIRPGVNMMETGINANWGGVWGANHPGPWITDPRPYLTALASGQGGTIDSSGTSTSNSSLLGIDPATLGMVTEHVMLFILASVFIIIGFVMMSKKQGASNSGVIIV